MINQEPHYLTAEDIFSNPQPSNSLEEAREAYLAEIKAEGPIDRVYLKKMRAWSELSGLIVGAEVPSRHY